MEKYQIEVYANSVESCLATQEGGVSRIELCVGISEDGTTPSYGEVATARKVLTHTCLHIIIQPRGGGFLYSDIEIRTMLRGIEIAQRSETDGATFGCLTADGEVDLISMQILMETPKGLLATFHRASGVCRDPQKALEGVIELECNRILASRQQPTAEQGIGLLEELQGLVVGRITLLADCGVSENNTVRVAAETRINEFHFSAHENIQSEMKFRNEVVSMRGTVHIDEYERNVISVQKVKETAEALYKRM